MYDQILKALGKGFSAQQVIDYIVRKFPKQAGSIQKALTMGFTADQLVRYLGGGKKAVNKWMEGNQEGQEINTEFAKTQSQDMQNQQSRNKMALGLGGAALGAAAIPLAAPMAQTALSRALPANVQKLAPALLPSPSNISPQSNTYASRPLVTGEPITPSPANIAQPPISPQPIPAQRDIQKNIALIKNVKEDQRISNLLSGGMQPTDIAALIKKVAPKDVSKALESAEGGIEGAIEDFAQSMQQKTPDQELQQSAPISDQIQPEPVPETEVLKHELPKEPKRAEKGSVVATPHGVGEVKEIRNGKALIDIEGKKHVVDEDKLEQEPPDIAELYDKLFEAIPDQYKSRMMNFAGYDEEHNELLFRPHGGGAYVYKDIPAEFADELKNRMHRAKTTGKNMYGMWSEGDQSFGAGMSALIKKLQAQYGGKGKEYVRKYNTLFDILGIPHEEKKRREEENRRQRKGNG